MSAIINNSKDVVNLLLEYKDKIDTLTKNNIGNTIFDYPQVANFLEKIREVEQYQFNKKREVIMSYKTAERIPEKKSIFEAVEEANNRPNIFYQLYMDKINNKN